MFCGGVKALDYKLYAMNSRARVKWPLKPLGYTRTWPNRKPRVRPAQELWLRIDEFVEERAEERPEGTNAPHNRSINIACPEDPPLSTWRYSLKLWPASLAMMQTQFGNAFET